MEQLSNSTKIDYIHNNPVGERMVLDLKIRSKVVLHITQGSKEFRWHFHFSQLKLYMHPREGIRAGAGGLFRFSNDVTNHTHK